MKPPLFIIGNPRSGTTLLRLMLTCHQSIVIPPECGFALWLYRDFRDWEVRDVDSRLSSFVGALMRCKKIETWGLNREALSDFLQSKRPRCYADLAAAVYEFYAVGISETFQRWGDKNNYYLDHIPEIKQLFPEASFVHIVRDGRNVACSYRALNKAMMKSKYAPRLPSELGEIAAHWQANLETIHRSFEAIEWQNVHELRFEDLVSNPEETLRKICDRLGECYDSEMLRYDRINRERHLEPQEFMSWKAKTLKPPIAAEAVRYQSELTAAECRDFETIAAPALKRYGYI